MNINDLIPSKADQKDEIAELRSALDAISSLVLQFFDSDKERHEALDEQLRLLTAQVENNTRAVDLAERLVDEKDA